MLSYTQEDQHSFLSSASNEIKKDGHNDHPFKMNLLSQIQSRI